MKILEINTEKTWRGGERQTLLNAIGLRDLGHEVEVLCRKNFPLEKKMQEAGFRVHTVDSGFQSFVFLAKNGNKFDVLHAQTSGAQSQCVSSKLFHKKPIVYSRRVDFVPRGFLTWVKYQRTDKVVAVSNAVRIILEQFGVKEAEVIPDCVRKEETNPLRAKQYLAEHKIPLASKIIGTTAALVPHKDPINMVRAIAQLRKWRDDFVFLHFGNGELEQTVKSEIEKSGLGSTYQLMGFVEKVEDFISILNVFCMSSEEEGLGSSILDAFVYKVPVASTNAGGLKELVEGNGLTCEKHDPHALALCINELLNDDSLVKDVTENAAQFATEKHSVKTIAQAYEAVFKSLISP